MSDEMTDSSLPDCPRCESSNVYEFGQTQDGRTTYRCNACDRGFNEEMTDSDPSDYPEVDVPLSQVDMEHLEAGQPVFKPGDGTRLVLCFNEWQDRGMVPVEALEDLVSLWLSEYEGYDNDPSNVPNSGHQAKCEQINKCVEDLEALITDYNE